MTNPDLAGTIAARKLDDIEKTGADTVVTACQQCIRTIKGTARKQKRNLDVVDITDLIIEALSDA
jgi:heterodisulfide reductase subunit D